MGTIYRREDWNGIIDRVNALASNPETGCTAVDTIPNVNPVHVWTIEDVETVRSKLTEICSDNTFSAELKLWKQDVIDEIIDALDAGWCNCQCPNTQTTPVETYLGVVVQSGCIEEGAAAGCDDPACRTHPVTEGQAAGVSISQWSTAYLQYCSGKAAVISAQAVLAAAQAVLPILEAAKVQACSEVPPTNCAAATQAVVDQQAAIATAQSALAAAIVLRDQAEADADKYEQEADEHAANSMSLASNFTVQNQAFTITAHITDLVWPFQCGTDNPLACRVFWSILTRLTEHTFGEIVHTWSPAMAGSYTPTGKPYILSMPQCDGISSIYCIAPSCIPSSYGLIVGCGDPSWTNTVEVKLIQTFPTPT